MPQQCIVKNCTSDDGISMHRFPDNTFLSNKWLNIICSNNNQEIPSGQQEDWTICENHFSENCFNTFIGASQHILKEGSFPTIFPNKDQNECEYIDDIDLGTDTDTDDDNNLKTDENSYVQEYVNVVLLTDPFEQPMETESSTKRIKFSIDEDSCSVIDCPSKRQTNSKIKFYQLPSCSENMPLSYQHIEKKQKFAWLQNVLFKDENPYKQICGRHFYAGGPANVLNYCHIDWVPSLHIGKPIKRQKFNNFYKPFVKNIGQWIFMDFQEKSTTSISTTTEFPQPVPINEPTNILNNDLIKNDIETNIEEEYFLDEPPNIRVDTIQNSDRHINSVTLSSSVLSLPIACKICNNDFNTLTSYFGHKLQNCSCLLAEQNCDICDVDHNDMDKTRAHLTNHLFRQKYFCKHCNQYEHASIIEQYEHLMILFGIAPIICVKCRATFTKQHELWTHIRVTHKNLSDRIMKKDCCESLTKLEQIGDAVTIKCKLCDKIINSITDHMKGHRNIRPFQCTKCDSCFRNRMQVIRHQQVHNRKMIVCTICNTVFYWAELFHKHMKMSHSTTDCANSFECRYCTVKFFHQQELEVHVNLNHRPYNCIYCTETFEFFKEFDAHLNDLHLDLSFEPPSPMYRIKCKTSSDEIENSNEFTICVNDKLISKVNPNQTTKKVFEIPNKSVVLMKTNSKSLVSIATDADSKKRKIITTVSYECLECKIRYKNESELVKHRTQIHNKMFRCKKCGIETTKIVEHMLQHRKCLACNITFDTTTALTEHQLKIH